MSEHLLSIALGPVQGFIAAARRTRDLWFGSHLLSEISKAAAAALHHAGAELIFPATSDPLDLEPDSPLIVANKILARLPVGLNPETMGEKARKAAVARWENFAGTTLAMASGAVQKEIWADQVGDVVEVFSAWAPLNGDYRHSRARVERLLAGRKCLRDFIPAKGRAGIPKSSLDGARESVLADPDNLGAQARMRAMLKDNEHLDCIGLVKRLAGEPDRFPSVARIAADPWVRGVAGSPGGREFLGAVSSLCDPAFTSRLREKRFSEFPWEGEVLFPSRVTVLLYYPDLAEHRQALGDIQEIFRKSPFGEPSPYLAVIVADGDRMGATLSSLDSPEAHRNFSSHLVRFTGKASGILAAHHGCLVYSGGDDVLAFVPLDQALACARSLHDEFAEAMRASGIEGACPTLSVAVSIGHCQALLEDLLRQARQTERTAKGATRQGGVDTRDGLALSLTTRGAETLEWRRQWTTVPDGILQHWVDLNRSGILPDKLAYDLRNLARDYRRMAESGAWAKIPGEALQKDVLRIIRKKRSRTGIPLPEDLLMELLGNIGCPDDVDDLSRALIIARRLGEAERAAAPRQEVTP